MITNQSHRGGVILIADDHPLLRRGVVSLIESFNIFNRVIEAANGAAAIDLAKKTKPKIVLLDISMPIVDGLQASRKIRACSPLTKIIIFSNYCEPKYVSEAMEMGVSAYLTKTSHPEEIESAIYKVLNGMQFLSPDVLQVWSNVLLRQAHEKAEISSKQGLSQREMEIIKLICRGQSTSDIANTLSLSISTVNNHKAHIFKKLNCHTIEQLIHFATLNGYTEQ